MGGKDRTGEMKPAIVKPTVAHDRERRQFEASVDGERCTLDYELDGAVMIITHVLVPDRVGGRGIAAALTAAALDTARDEGWRVVPQCPYAAAFVARHTEYADLIAAR